jgi:hypothetical protein
MLMMCAVGCFCAGEVKAQIIQLPKTLQNSEWEITEWRTAGNIYSGSEEMRAEQNIGKTVLLHINSGTLENGKECPIKSIEAEQLRDGNAAFGSGGGSWSKLGFVEKDGMYHVTRITFDCGKDDWPQKDIVYSEENGVFVRETAMSLMLKRRN